MPLKNKYGQYFTISVVAEFMVNLISKSKDSKILEPACGKGVFLDMLDKYGFTNVSAYEIDPTLTTYHNYVKYQSFLSVPTSEKYSVVIGNPPYIRWKNIEPELKKELETNFLWNKYFNSLCDYLFIFILKSIEHLEDNGELIFICTEYWMNTTNSITLRNYMCSNGYVEEIYHFKETPLFEKVTASFIVFKFVKSTHHKDVVSLYKFNKEKGLPSFEELNSKSCFDQEIIPQFKKNSRWVLASQEIQDKLYAFECGCINHNNIQGLEQHRIGDFCDIGNGMVSGLDMAFQINDISELNSNEQNSIINVLKAKDLKPYYNTTITKYIFIQEKLNQDDFSKKYPHFVSHFAPYLDKLNNRYNYGKNIPYWEFVFPRNQKLFDRKASRIFIPCKERISNKKYFRFCFAPEGFYPTQDVTAIFRKPYCKESIEYLLAYLNNNRVFEWLSLNGIVKGAIVEFSEAPIASIPYRPINWNKSSEVHIHSLITQEVQEYLLDKSSSHIKIINKLFNKLFNE